MGKRKASRTSRTGRQIRSWRADSPVHVGSWNAAACKSGLEYERWRCLPRLIRVEFSEMHDSSPACGRRILARLSLAIERERRRARTGHWSYDVNRHIALLQAKKAERELLTRRERAKRCRFKKTLVNCESPHAVAATGSAAPTASRPDRRTALLTGTKASCDKIMVTAQPSSDKGKRNQNCTR